MWIETNEGLINLVHIESLVYEPEGSDTNLIATSTSGTQYRIPFLRRPPTHEGTIVSFERTNLIKELLIKGGLEIIERKIRC